MNTFGLNSRGISTFGLLIGEITAIVELLGDRIAAGSRFTGNTSNLEFVNIGRKITTGSKRYRSKFTVKRR